MALEFQLHICRLCDESARSGWRKIHSVESRAVYNELESIARSSVIRPLVQIETFLPENGYLCGKCFQSVSKLIRTKEHLKHLEDEITNKVTAKLASINGKHA